GKNLSSLASFFSARSMKLCFKVTRRPVHVTFIGQPPLFGAHPAGARRLLGARPRRGTGPRRAGYRTFIIAISLRKVKYFYGDPIKFVNCSQRPGLAGREHP